MTGPDSPLRVLVCGSTFGQFYLAAMATAPEAFVPAGLLARGSARSRAVAARAGVPLYTEVADLPDDLDAACVVVRSGALGGPGGRLAHDLLGRGLHVLQEHPVHHDELASCLRAAAAAGVGYRVGDLYPQLPATRRFVTAARRLHAAAPIESIEAACSVQLLFPLLHVLGAVLGSPRPWTWEAWPAPAGAGWTALHGTAGGVPVLLRVHTELDPDRPDDHLHLPYQVGVHTAAGRLVLTDVHGPLAWHPRLHVPDAVKERFDVDGPGTEHLGERPTEHLGPREVPTYREALADVWPRAIARDLHELRDAARGGPDRGAGQRLLTLAAWWRAATECLGYPSMRPGQLHRPLPVAVLAAAVADGASP